MTVHARPEPADAPRLHAPSSQQLLITAQRQQQETAGLLERLERHYQAACAPAQMRSIRLTAQTPRKTDEAGVTAMSVGIYNPSSAVVYLGVEGIPAQPDRGALSVPASGLVVLPITVTDIELGADPAALAGGDAVLWVLRFETVQAAFVGAI